MPSLLNTSLTGLIAFQRALDMTGHNIANANTPGYSRQVGHFTARIGGGAGSGYIGGGTQLREIKRVYDELLGEQLKNATTGHARFGVLAEMTSRMDTLLADPQTGLSASMQGFFNAVQDVANDPASIPARQAVLGEADGIIERFRALDSRFAELGIEVNQRIATAVDDINRLANSIATINDQIVLGSGISGRPPNDLMDQRDLLVRQLGEQVAISTTIADDGSMSVFMGSGQALVIGKEVKEVGTRGSEFDPTSLQIVYKGSAGNTPLDNSLTGGIVGGLLEFRSRLLDPARQSLGETAVALASQFNQQHRAGMDLRGTLGTDFFGIGQPTVLTSGFNTGSGVATATIADVGALTGADYILEYDGANYSLMRADTQQAVAMPGTGTGAVPFVADGLEFVVGGAPAAGDRLLIRPTRDAAGSLGRVLDDPQALAMATPVRAESSDANLGDATIGNVFVTDATDPNLLSPVLIEFTSPTTYSVNGAGSFTYTSGAPIALNGYTFQIDGLPASGDQFTLGANTGASGDNGNGLLLADVQSQGVLAGGTISINDNYGQLVANVGSTSRQVQANLDAQSVILGNTEASYQAKSGVNLDEEAANLVRYQQAYQAVAQIVAVTSTLFDSLLRATGR